jgi:hypothetical protein
MIPALQSCWEVSLKKRSLLHQNLKPGRREKPDHLYLNLGIHYFCSVLFMVDENERPKIPERLVRQLEWQYLNGDFII